MKPPMNFHLAAKNVRLENNRYLKALISFTGKWEEVTLDLDLYIGNNNGSLSWGGSSESLFHAEEMQYANMPNPRSDFSQEATNVRLGKDPGCGWCPLLCATVKDSNGVAKNCGIYLGRCIGIEYGHLACGMTVTQHYISMTLTEFGRHRYQ